MEKERLNKCFKAREATLSCLFGRRRCGKSRLVHEAVRGMQATLYVGDERDAALQRQSLAQAVTLQIPGFNKVIYPDWESLFGQYWDRAPEGSILVLDEFPWLVQMSPELPGLIQKRIDDFEGKGLHVVICGSSQRMMQGFVLDRSAPLFGRAREIIEVKPLGLKWFNDAAGFDNARETMEAYSVWGGVPRYWELALEYPSTLEAIEKLILDPMGILNREPETLLFDDMRELSQAASVLSVIGQGCHRLSEIAGRLSKPATGLSRPLHRLLELGLVAKETPFGSSARDNKKTLYKIKDPFLRFWFRYVDSNRSILDTGRTVSVLKEIQSTWNVYMGQSWEELSRNSVHGLKIGGYEWRPASRWWGAGLDRTPLEIDVAAESVDGRALLIGEAKLNLTAKEAESLIVKLKEKAKRFPLSGEKKTVLCIFTPERLLKSKECAFISCKEIINVLD